MTDTLPALIERLERATEGSVYLDFDILLLTDGKDPDEHVMNPQFVHLIPKYTTSIDAAATLVPEGAWVRIEHRREHQTGEKLCHAGFDLNRAPYAMYAQAKTFPLALCLAALRARVKG